MFYLWLCEGIHTPMQARALCSNDTHERTGEAPMANVVWFNPASFVDTIPPGGDYGISIGPSPLYANSTVTVTAWPYEPLFDTTSISVQETTVQWQQNGDRYVWATLR